VCSDGQACCGWLDMTQWLFHHQAVAIMIHFSHTIKIVEDYATAFDQLPSSIKACLAPHVLTSSKYRCAASICSGTHSDCSATHVNHTRACRRYSQHWLQIRKTFIVQEYFYTCGFASRLLPLKNFPLSCYFCTLLFKTSTTGVLSCKRTPHERKL
jgi:hypothetical protein